MSIRNNDAQNRHSSAKLSDRSLYASKEYWNQELKKGDPLAETVKALLTDSCGQSYSLHSIGASSNPSTSNSVSSALRGNYENRDALTMFQSIGNRLAEINISSTEMRLLKRAALCSINMLTNKKEAARIVELAKTIDNWRPPREHPSRKAFKRSLQSHTVRITSRINPPSTQLQRQLAVHLESAIACLGGERRLKLERNQHTLLKNILSGAVWEEYSVLASTSHKAAHKLKKNEIENNVADLIDTIFNALQNDIEKEKSTRIVASLKKFIFTLEDRLATGKAYIGQNGETPESIQSSINAINARIAAITFEHEHDQVHALLQTIVNAYQDKGRML